MSWITFKTGRRRVSIAKDITTLIPAEYHSLIQYIEDHSASIFVYDPDGVPRSLNNLPSWLVVRHVGSFIVVGKVPARVRGVADDAEIREVCKYNEKLLTVEFGEVVKRTTLRLLGRLEPDQVKGVKRQSGTHNV